MLQCIQTVLFVSVSAVSLQVWAVLLVTSLKRKVSFHVAVILGGVQLVGYIPIFNHGWLRGL
ncbi:hypothetical protein D3C87_2179670 [compost metagenome]